MMRKCLYTTLLVCFCICFAYAQLAPQNQSFKNIAVAVEKDTAFDRTMDYLQANDFFIQSVDKQAGFIQARIYKKNKKILSAKAGERRILNFILRPKGRITAISLNIYLEERFFGGDISDRSYYYEEKGVLEDKAAYQEILVPLQKTIDQ